MKETLQQISNFLHFVAVECTYRPFVLLRVRNLRHAREGWISLSTRQS